MNRFQAMAYTIRHKKAFLKVEKELLGKNTISGYLHDIDKIFLYPIFGKKRTHQFHRKHVKHHFDNAKNTKYKIQMIIDWECARYTKPDKPLSAYGFMMAAHPESKNELLPLMKHLGMEK